MNSPSLSASRVRVRTLRRASEIMGGASALRKVLKVSALSLSVWMTGAEAPPTDVFLKAVDIIAEREAEKLRS